MDRDPKGYYERLFVTPDAGDEEIKKAWRRVSQGVHPDSARSPEERAWKTEAQKKVNEAYDVLGNPAKRRAYDQSVSSSSQSATGQSPKWQQTWPTSSPPPPPPRPQPPPRQATPSPGANPPPRPAGPRYSATARTPAKKIDLGEFLFSAFVVFCVAGFANAIIFLTIVEKVFGKSTSAGLIGFAICQIAGFMLLFRNFSKRRNRHQQS